MLIWIESYYIDSNNGYDYYIETVRNGSKYEANCFVKKKDGENISAFDLQKLNLSKWNDEIYGSGGFYSDGYIRFRQKIGNRYREVSDDVILDYIENLKSLANIGG